MPNRIPQDWSPVGWIETPAELTAALEVWEKASVIGIDTESNSFHAYTDRLCLLQVTVKDEDWIVDPLALGEDLQRINPLLANPDIVKVLHAAEYDLMLLKKDLGAKMFGLFDSQVAITLLGYEKTGLAFLLESCCGITSSKKEQRSDWGARPLTQSQLDYARTDTHFLPGLHTQLVAELEEKKLFAAAEGEFRRLEREVLEPKPPDLDRWRRLKGASRLDPVAAARLRALFAWREGLACEMDRPLFRVMSNETLLDLAANPPRTLKDFSGRRGVGWNRGRKMADSMFAALESAKGERVEARQEAPVDPAERRRRKLLRANQDRLRQWRKNKAVELGLPSERLMHRRHLEEIGKKLPLTSEALLRIVPLTDWQRENLESSLLDCLAALPHPEPKP